MLTSIAIESIGPDETRTLLARFVREFAPEQVKQYLAREIIARLPNASAIDLSQFAGLEMGGEPSAAARSDYEDLLDELRSDEPEVAKPYEVSLAGRWSETPLMPQSAPGKRPPPGMAPTPLAGDEASTWCSRTRRVRGGSHCRPWCQGAGIRSARTTVATSSSTACMRAAVIARCGSTRARGG